MALDEIIRSVVEGDVEQLLIYIPIFIIGIGFLIILITYVKDNWKTLSDKLSKLKKRRKPLSEEQQKIEVDYKKEIENILEKNNPTKAMDGLSVLINQYFLDLFDMHHSPAFAYEELIDELEKKGKPQLKGFCENLLRIEFSKNEVSREELEKVAYQFLDITKEYPLKKAEQISSKKFIQRINFFKRLSRFKRELQKDLEKKKTFKDKLNKVIEKTSKTIWKSVKDCFSSTKVPKKVSLTTVLEDVNQSRQKKESKAIFGEDRLTIEDFFYFLYLLIRKKIRKEKGKEEEKKREEEEESKRSEEKAEKKDEEKRRREEEKMKRRDEKERLKEEAEIEKLEEKKKKKEEELKKIKDKEKRRDGNDNKEDCEQPLHSEKELSTAEDKKEKED